MSETNSQSPQEIAEFSEPFTLFGTWLAEAEKTEPNDPNAVALATVGADMRPSVRMLLLKAWDEAGFVLYTNLGSRKGQELTGNANASLLFHWKSLRRQIRIEGKAVPVSDAESDAYFASRPRASQIGAWASRQSEPMQDRFEFEAAIAKYTAKFGVAKVPRPEFWAGFRIVPQRFEFWQDRKFRLHDRNIYERLEASSAQGGAAVHTPAWATSRLYP